MTQPNTMPDFDALWQHIESIFALDLSSLHGPRHWRRVQKFGLRLAETNGADITVVRLFAVLHDCQRLDEDTDAGHGLRGADSAAFLRGRWFQIEDEQFARLYEAIAYHEDGATTDDVTIGTCWDADRLDLGRVGMIPSARFMSTPEAKRLLQEKRDRQ